jgi:hypothetical protein
MIVAGRIAGLLAIVAIGLAVGRHYHVGGFVKLLTILWLPISVALSFAVAFVGAPAQTVALSRYETTPPSLSGERVFVGVVAAALATFASCFMLLVGILTR